MSNLSNLPPGVTESMIPGNRPEDMAWDRFHEEIDEDCGSLGLDPEDARALWKASVSLSKVKNDNGDWPRAFMILVEQLRDNGIWPEEEAMNIYREARGPFPWEEPVHPKDQLSRETRMYGAQVSGERTWDDFLFEEEKANVEASKVHDHASDEDCGECRSAGHVPPQEEK